MKKHVWVVVERDKGDHEIYQVQIFGKKKRAEKFYDKLRDELLGEGGTSEAALWKKEVQ